MTTPTQKKEQNANSNNDANNNSSIPTVPNPLFIHAKVQRWKKDAALSAVEAERTLPRFVFDPDSAAVCYWTAAVAMALLYNAWTIALRIAFPEIRHGTLPSWLPFLDVLCDVIYVLDIFIQFRTAYLQDGIPVFDTLKIRQQYLSQTCFIQDVIAVLPSHTILALLPEGLGWCKYYLCTAGAARLTKLLKFHILYKFYDLAESFTSNPHLIRVLRLFLNLAIIIHWIACLYYLLSEYEGLGTTSWVYTNSTSGQRFGRKYIRCLYWSAMTLTTIGDTNPPETDVEYIFTGVIFLTGVFVFATVMGNVGDVISSMNANRQEFQARMDHIQMYLTHKKVPASLQLKIKKWAEYTWSRTKATDESRLLNMLPERLRAEVAVHVHLDSLKKVKIFEQCETGFLCELVLKLRSQVFSPGDYVCRVGETGREMFIINHGKVEVVVNNPSTGKPMVVAVLSEGNYFGEISLLRLDGVQNRRTADVRSIGYSELLCLSRRDLMTALVEYPEAKSVLEDQAKKRMKTNLQAQRAFSVDALLRNSQDRASMDSGICRDEVTGQEVSEIKAMIEDLKNSSKVPGRTVWQLIARCEVLQTRLGEKEKEIEDSKHRIKDLEQLLFSHHRPRNNSPLEEESSLSSEPNTDKLLRAVTKVTKQFSQEEGRRVPYEGTDINEPEGSEAKANPIPDVKITKPDGDSSDELEQKYTFKDDNFIKTSKITNVYEKGGSNWNRFSSSGSQSKTVADNCGFEEESSFGGTRSIEVCMENLDKNFKMISEDIWNFPPTMDFNFSNETVVDHRILLDDNEEMSVSTSFKDQFSVTDSLNFNVPTIPEEPEDEVLDAKDSSHGSKWNLLPFSKKCEGSGKSEDSTTEMPPVERDKLKAQIPRTCSVDNLPSGIFRKEHHGGGSSDCDGMKRVCSSPGLQTGTSDAAISFLRMISRSSACSDDTNSRRNSWTLGSENDSDEDDASSLS